MIIVYFEYGAKVFFFGVTAGKQTTHCSPSRDEVANELYTLQRNEWTEGAAIPEPEDVQGMALRSIAFIEGRWVAVDIEDGIMTIVTVLDDGDFCCCISASEPDEVIIVDGPEAASDFIDQLGSSHGLGG